MKKIRFGLIGCGRIAVRHMESVEIHKDQAVMMAVCDVDAKALKKFQKNYKVADGYTDYKKILARDDIDVVVICTPNGLHKKMAVDVARSGKHALVEKPIAIKIKDVDVMIREFKKARKKLFSVLQVRHNPPIKFMKRFVADGKLGKIRLADLKVRWYRPEEYFKESWRGTKKMDGGSLLNQGIHYVDVLQWLVGMPNRIYGKALNLCHKIEIEDTALAMMRLKNGGWAQISFTLCNYPKNSECSLTIVGERGNVKIGGVALNEIEEWEIPDVVKPKLPESIMPNVYANGMYQGSCPYHFKVYKDMLDCLLSVSKNMIDGDEARKSILISESIYDSSKSGAEVKVG